MKPWTKIRTVPIINIILMYGFGVNAIVNCIICLKMITIAVVLKLAGVIVIFTIIPSELNPLGNLT